MDELMMMKAEKLNLTLSDGKFKGKIICTQCGEKFDVETLNPYVLPSCCGKTECEKKIYVMTSRCYQCKKSFDYDSRKCDGIPGYCSEKCLKDAREEKAKKKILTLLPEKYHDLITDKYKDFKESGFKDKNLFIWGGTGTGKSVFMASLAKSYLQYGYDIKWITYPKFILNLQGAYARKEDPFALAERIAVFPDTPKDDWGAYIKGKRDKAILFIDDLGAEKLTDHVRQITYYIINEREEKQLKTVISSNFSLSQIDSQIDSRISSRIAGMCEVLKFGGKDKRLGIT